MSTPTSDGRPEISAATATQLAPGGDLRVAINLGNVVLAGLSATGEPFGVTVDLARELGERVDRPVRWITYPTGGAVIPGLASDGWDVAFLAVEPERAKDVAFTAPYVFIDGTYIVRNDAPFQSVADLDDAGVRIAVGQGAAYDLALTRRLRHATLVRAPTSIAAVDLFIDEGLDAAAGIRQALVDAAAKAPGFRVLPDSFSRIEQALAIPKGRPAAARFLDDFIAEMTSNGFVRRALDRHGQTGAIVAGPRPD